MSNPCPVNIMYSIYNECLLFVNCQHNNVISGILRVFTWENIYNLNNKLCLHTPQENNSMYINMEMWIIFTNNKIVYDYSVIIPKFMLKISQ